MPCSRPSRMPRKTQMKPRAASHTIFGGLSAPVREVCRDRDQGFGAEGFRLRATVRQCRVDQSKLRSQELSATQRRMKCVQLLRSFCHLSSQEALNKKASFDGPNPGTWRKHAAWPGCPCWDRRPRSQRYRRGSSAHAWGIFQGPKKHGGMKRSMVQQNPLFRFHACVRDTNGFRALKL